MTKKWQLPLLALLILASCKKDNGEENNNTGNNGGGTTAGPLFASVKSVLQANCALSGCHAGATPQNGINFTNDDVIVTQSARIKARAVDAAGTPTQMPPPPAAPLSEADRKKITDWIAAGGRKTN